MKTKNKRRDLLKPFRPFNSNPLSPSFKENKNSSKILKTKDDGK